MNAIEVRDKLDALIAAGHGDEEVYLDTGPHDLYTIEDIDLDADGVGIIIWKV